MANNSFPLTVSQDPMTDFMANSSSQPSLPVQPAQNLAPATLTFSQHSISDVAIKIITSFLDCIDLCSFSSVTKRQATWCRFYVWPALFMAQNRAFFTAHPDIPHTFNIKVIYLQIKQIEIAGQKDLLRDKSEILTLDQLLEVSANGLSSPKNAMPERNATPEAAATPAHHGLAAPAPLTGSSSSIPPARTEDYRQHILFEAARHGYAELVTLIARYEPNELNKKILKGYYHSYLTPLSPLKLAINWVHFSPAQALNAVETLVHAGSDLSECDDQNRTLLMHLAIEEAIWKSPETAVQFKKIANCLIQHKATMLNAVDRKGRSVLRHALNNSAIELLLQLLKAPYPPDINSQIAPLQPVGNSWCFFSIFDIPGTTALMEAAQTGDVKFVKILLEFHADVNLSDINGMTALMYALRSHTLATIYNDYATQAELVSILIRHGANLHAIDQQGRTIMHHAAEKGSLETLRTLFPHFSPEKRISLLNKEDNQGITPFVHVLRRYWDSADMCELFLDNGVNLEQVDRNGATPLMHAAREGTIFKVDLLIQRGANVLATDRKGKTALDYAHGGFSSVTTAIRNAQAARKSALSPDKDAPLPIPLEPPAPQPETVMSPFLPHLGNEGARQEASPKLPPALPIRRSQPVQPTHRVAPTPPSNLNPAFRPISMRLRFASRVRQIAKSKLTAHAIVVIGIVFLVKAQIVASPLLATVLSVVGVYSARKAILSVI